MEEEREVGAGIFMVILQRGMIVSELMEEGRSHLKKEVPLGKCLDS